MRKKLLIISFLFFLFIDCKAQDNPNTKNIGEFQGGLIGIWTTYQLKIKNQFYLKSEIGLVGNFWSDYGLDFLPTASITFEPRFYYNLKKRQQKQKDISNISANFFSLKLAYEVPLGVSENAVSFIPTWGIRRNLRSKFNYEAMIGFGYQHYLSTTIFNSIDGFLVPYIGLRLSYRFTK